MSDAGPIKSADMIKLSLMAANEKRREEDMFFAGILYQLAEHLAHARSVDKDFMTAEGHGGIPVPDEIASQLIEQLKSGSPLEEILIERARAKLNGIDPDAE